MGATPARGPGGGPLALAARGAAPSVRILHPMLRNRKQKNYWDLMYPDRS